MNDNEQGHVLIVGASGLVGSAAANSFIDAGWQVTTASRRRPYWVSGKFTHQTLDLTDPTDCQRIAKIGNISHIVYASVFELPGLIAGWSEPQQIDTNDQMLRNLLGAVCPSNPVQHISLLQGTKAYGATIMPMRIPARESYARVDHPNFYWRQEDFVREFAEIHDFAYTILRPQLIVGPNFGVVMNLPPVIGAYAAIRKFEGLPFSFPGGADWIWEAVDARIVGNACRWAATSANAQGETFNLTNGEVFTWRDMWPAIAETLGAEQGPDNCPDNCLDNCLDNEGIDLATYLESHHATWQTIVSQQGLMAIELKDLLGESHHYANLCLNCNSDQSPPPTFVSTVKIKQAGFSETMNSEASFCYWLKQLQDHNVLPKTNPR